MVSSFGACFGKCGEWRWDFGVWKKWRNGEAMVVLAGGLLLVEALTSSGAGFAKIPAK